MSVYFKTMKSFGLLVDIDLLLKRSVGNLDTAQPRNSIEKNEYQKQHHESNRQQPGSKELVLAE